jgi:hypothetical protein
MQGAVHIGHADAPTVGADLSEPERTCSKTDIFEVRKKFKNQKIRFLKNGRGTCILF